MLHEGQYARTRHTQALRAARAASESLLRLLFAVSAVDAASGFLYFRQLATCDFRPSCSLHYLVTKSASTRRLAASYHQRSSLPSSEILLESPYSGNGSSWAFPRPGPFKALLCKIHGLRLSTASQGDSDATLPPCGVPATPQSSRLRKMRFSDFRNLLFFHFFNIFDIWDIHVVPTPRKNKKTKRKKTTTQSAFLLINYTNINPINQKNEHFCLEFVQGLRHQLEIPIFLFRVSSSIQTV